MQFWSPGGIWQCLETFSMSRGGVILLASRSWGPGVLLSAQQCPGMGPPQNGPAGQWAHCPASGGNSSGRFECCLYSTHDSE